MRNIDVSEFSEHVAEYLYGGQPLAVEQEGRTLGYYLPVPRANEDEVREALHRLGETVERILAETGMTEDEFANLFDFNRPFPYDTEVATQAAHAPGS